REDGHHARRDAGPVGPGDGEERRGAGGAHGFSWWFAWHALNPAGTGVPAGFIRPRRPRVSSGAVHGPGSVSLRRRSALGLVLGRIGAARLGTSTDVGLGPHPLTHVRVVQLERRALGADPRQRGEVVARRRAGRGPLERVARAPRVVDGDDLAVAPALDDVPD